MTSDTGDEILTMLESEITVAEMMAISGLDRESVYELAQAGFLRVLRSTGAEWSFDPGCVPLARRIRRLRAGFDLDDAGMLLALSLFERIDALEARLRELECRLPR
ncbi:MAG TPA: chaperone modulator CbpM [Rhodocyclaceae bacterium]|jgi:hypothetical protein|nr:chaperone modulator CbpM [Rhodocyclaceae bacterium]